MADGAWIVRGGTSSSWDSRTLPSRSTVARVKRSRDAYSRYFARDANDSLPSKEDRDVEDY